MNGVVRQRIATAIALALPLIAIISWSPGWLTAAVFAVFVAIAADEWARLCGVHGPFMRAAYIGLTTGLVAMAYVSRDDSHQVAMVLAAAGIWWLLAAMLLAVVQMREAPLVVPRSVQLVLGLLVLVPAWLALVVLHGLSAWLLLATLVIVWTADIAAFFAGRAFGRHKLASRISPGKTWEGALAGIAAAAVLGAFAAHQVSALNIGIGAGASLAGITAAMSIVGDLFESHVKRVAGVKDSGALLPGHGGVLDRIDSLAAAAPVFWLGLMLIR